MAQTILDKPDLANGSRLADLGMATPPRHFDSAWPLGVKYAVGLALLLGAFFLDKPVAAWVQQAEPMGHVKGDLVREFMFLEQFGQWACSLLVIAAVLLIDRLGRRRALALGIACLVTALASYLLKDLLGRPRPMTEIFDGMLAGDRAWQFGGPAMGFTHGSAWGSFPSAHTTGAFALACGLAWFYPRARGLFMMLALITAAQRVLHNAHYVSDVVGGAMLAITVSRLTLGWNWAGKVIGVLPGGGGGVGKWFRGENK